MLYSETRTIVLIGAGPIGNFTEINQGKLRAGWRPTAGQVPGRGAANSLPYEISRQTSEPLFRFGPANIETIERTRSQVREFAGKNP